MDDDRSRTCEKRYQTLNDRVRLVFTRNDESDDTAKIGLTQTPAEEVEGRTLTRRIRP